MYWIYICDNKIYIYEQRYVVLSSGNHQMELKLMMFQNVIHEKNHAEIKFCMRASSSYVSKAFEIRSNIYSFTILYSSIHNINFFTHKVNEEQDMYTAILN